MPEGYIVRLDPETNPSIMDALRKSRRVRVNGVDFRRDGDDNVPGVVSDTLMGHEIAGFADVPGYTIYHADGTIARDSGPVVVAAAEAAQSPHMVIGDRPTDPTQEIARSFESKFAGANSRERERIPNDEYRRYLMQRGVPVMPNAVKADLIRLTMQTTNEAPFAAESNTSQAFGEASVPESSESVQDDLHRDEV